MVLKLPLAGIDSTVGFAALQTVSHHQLFERLLLKPCLCRLALPMAAAKRHIPFARRCQTSRLGRPVTTSAAGIAFQALADAVHTCHVTVRSARP